MNKNLNRAATEMMEAADDAIIKLVALAIINNPNSPERGVFLTIFGRPGLTPAERQYAYVVSDEIYALAAEYDAQDEAQLPWFDRQSPLCQNLIMFVGALVFVAGVWLATVLGEVFFGV